jgi:hypothetical protein
MQTDLITELVIPPQLLAKAVEALRRLPPSTTATFRVRTITILDMLIDEGVVAQVVETGIAIQARLDAYIELMSCPALAELYPATAQLPDERILYAIANAPLRLVDGRYRFSVRDLLTILLEDSPTPEL